MLLALLQAPFARGSSTDEAVLGMESVADWGLVEGDGDILLDEFPSNGTSALRIAGQGWRRIQSTPVATLGSGDPSVLQLDVKVAAGGLSPWESVGVVVKIPSAGLYWSDLGYIQLDTLEANVWSTISLPIPAQVKQALIASAVQDIVILLSVNTAAAPVSFDALRLLPSSVGAPPTPPHIGLPDQPLLGKPYIPRFQLCTSPTTAVGDTQGET